MSQSLNFLQQRVSYHVHELTHPAPNAAQLMAILSAAMSTPDHGNLTPWHFIHIGRQQVASFIEHLRAAWLASDEHVTPAQAKRLASYLVQAPSLVLVSAAPTAHREVSQQDQVFSAVAACQNILLAADATGFGGVWYSTEAVTLPTVRELLGLSPQHCPVGFLVLGSPIRKRLKKRQDPQHFTFQWLRANTLVPWDGKAAAEADAEVEHTQASAKPPPTAGDAQSLDGC